MWECGKCSENVEDNFDRCWNCGTSKDGVEDPDFQRAAEGTEGNAADEPETPSETLTCAKCNSEKIVPRVRIMDRGHYGSDTGKDLTVVFYEDPDAFIFKGAHTGSLFARVCGECGYTEMFLTNPEDLYSVYKDGEDRQKASTENEEDE